MTLTNQEIFDKALQGIRSQDYRPSMSGEACRYAGPNSTACAVGHCIPREVGEGWDNMPDSTIHSVFTRKPEEYDRYFTAGQVVFLSSLQTIHDRKLKYGSDFFEAEMADLAIKYQLDYTKP